MVAKQKQEGDRAKSEKKIMEGHKAMRWWWCKGHTPRQLVVFRTLKAVSPSLLQKFLFLGVCFPRTCDGIRDWEGGGE